jgi:hypothetical protein
MSAINYAPVDHFSAEITDGAIAGIAAPIGGSLPCQVGLFAGDVPVAFARAARFSQEAEDAAIRLGWCGFKLQGLDQALALGGPVEVRCGASGAVLMKPKIGPEIFSASVRSPRVLSVFEAIFITRAAEGCPDVARLAVFGREHLRRHGPRGFLAATYRTILGREADPVGIAMWDGAADYASLVEQFIADMVESAEYEAIPVRVLPGPFQTAFAYDQTLIA